MNGIEPFLYAYGLPAIFVVLLVKSIGVPIPIPADVIMLLTAARVAEGRLVFWQAVLVVLIALVAGSMIQFWLARGPGRTAVYRLGRYLGLTDRRLDAAAALVRRSNPIGLGLIILTPGVRSASVIACGLADLPLRTFVVGLLLGHSLFLSLHFFLGATLGAAWLQVTRSMPTAITLALLALVLIAGFGAWVLIRRYQQPAAARAEVLGAALEGFHEAGCPVCLALGAIDRVNPAARVTRHSQVDLP